MLEIFQSVLPVFLIIGAGYVVARTGYVKADISDNLNALAVKVAVPVLLFRAMYTLDFEQAFQAMMLVSFYTGAVVSFILGILLAIVIWKRRPGEAVAVGFCAFFSNTVLLGIPIYERAFSGNGMAPVFGIIAFHAPCVYAIGILTMEIARRDGRPLGEAMWRTLKSILSNSLMIGVVLGASLNLLNVSIPIPIFTAVDMVATAAIPIALIGIGASLTRYQLKKEVSESLMVSLLSLLIHPLIALVLSHFVFGLPIQLVTAAVVIAAMPPGLNVYIFATMYNRAEGLAASTILISTILSIASIAFWIAIVKLL